MSAKSETWNLTVTARVDDRKRLMIPKAVADVPKLSEGDIVTFIITQINRAELKSKPNEQRIQHLEELKK